MRSLKANFLLVASICLSGALVSQVSQAEIFTANQGTDVVGQNLTINTTYADSFHSLADRYNIPYDVLVRANPRISPTLPGDGTKVFIPGQVVLPNVSHKGIIVNPPERRIYYFYGNNVAIFPIAVGAPESPTPTLQTRVTSKAINPTWNVPDEIYEEHIQKNDPIPRVVPPGPENPLGDRAFKLAGTLTMIHGTNGPTSIGKRLSHGCIRLYPQDIRTLYSMVPVGTTVNLVNEPFKVGWLGGQLYLQASAPLQEANPGLQANMSKVRNLIAQETRGRDTNINWGLVQQLVQNPNDTATVINNSASDYVPTTTNGYNSKYNNKYNNNYNGRSYRHGSPVTY